MSQRFQNATTIIHHNALPHHTHHRGSFSFTCGEPNLRCRQKHHRLTGTYSNLYFNREAGDLLGVELRIAATRNGYQGVLQFAEGVPEDLILVNLQVKGQEIQFVIPESSPYAGSFSGVVRNGVLTGHFKYKNIGAQDIILKKGKSYWD